MKLKHILHISNFFLGVISSQMIAYNVSVCLKPANKVAVLFDSENGTMFAVKFCKHRVNKTRHIVTVFEHKIHIVPTAAWTDLSLELVVGTIEATRVES